MDVKKLGRVPDGGGWRLHGRREQVRGRSVHGHGLGYDFLHVAVDDHSRLAYVEAHPDEHDPLRPGSCAAPSAGSLPTAWRSSGY